MLTAAEYGEATRNKSLLQNKIVNIRAEVVELGRLSRVKVVEAKAAMDALELYTNHLSGDISEYEKAQPKEEVV